MILRLWKKLNFDMTCWKLNDWSFHILKCKTIASKTVSWACRIVYEIYGRAATCCCFYEDLWLNSLHSMQFSAYCVNEGNLREIKTCDGYGSFDCDSLLWKCAYAPPTSLLKSWDICPVRLSVTLIVGSPWEDGFKWVPCIVFEGGICWFWKSWFDLWYSWFEW